MASLPLVCVELTFNKLVEMGNLIFEWLVFLQMKVEFSLFIFLEVDGEHCISVYETRDDSSS